jgi:hypothetical protein
MDDKQRLPRDRALTPEQLARINQLAGWDEPFNETDIKRLNKAVRLSNESLESLAEYLTVL